MSRRAELRKDMDVRPDISLVIPMHNEEGNIEPLLSSLIGVLRGLNYKFEIIVVNDNSTDRTAEIADTYSRSYPEVTVIHRYDGRRGVGFNYRAGFKSARGETVLTMDGDMSHDPRDLPRILQASRGATMVVGSRYTRGATADMPVMRVILSRIFNMAVSAFFLVGVRDLTSGYRAIRRESLATVKLESDGFDVYPELLLRIALRGERITEVPIHYIRRRAGESKLSYVKTLAPYMISLFRLRFRATRKRPHSSPSL